MAATLSRALDRFLFPIDTKKGAVFHQMPTSRTKPTSSADYLIGSMQNDTPGNVVLVGDFKTSQMDKTRAFNQSIKYCMDAAEMHDKKFKELYLV